MKTKKVTWILFGMVYLAACTTTSSPSVTPIPSQIPTQTTSPVTVTACNPAQFIEVLRQVVPYEEISISYNHFSDTANLMAWFVDPALNPQASDSEIQDLTELAIRHSIEIAHSLAFTEPCITAVFDSLTVIAVDHLYHAWYVGAVPPSKIPITEMLSEDEWTELEGMFDAGYQRTERVLEGEVPEIPEGGCAWPEARQKLKEAFTQAQKNVALYYYIDPDGGSVYVQWDIPPVAETAQQINDYFFIPLPTIDTAVSCLYPPFDTLWLFYVRQDGKAQWIFAIDGEAVRAEDHQEFIDHLELIYQTTAE
ncbi:MAG: hypothetical protein A2Z14_15705 [Chloroflexi bacterium RBG_16_48_8]|nr:MAG: hypothetical protein A2Z14_15705 [Chloroflexi bacterium RBG_16_48_8]